MIFKHKIMKVNDEEVLFVYLDVSMEEFAEELGGSPSEREKNLQEQVSDYIKKKRINFSGKIVKVIAGSLLVATLSLAPANFLHAEAKTVTTNTAYVVKTGDSLWKIAQDTGISVESLKTINHLSSDTIRPGQTLMLVPNAEIGTYTVKAGDSLWTIAQKYAMSVNDLKELNNTGDIIHPGQVLKVIQAKVTKHIVISGESLWTIARKYGISVDSLKKANGLTSDVIHPGQTLTIPNTAIAPQDNSAPALQEHTVRVKRSNGAIQNLNLEDYVVGVVASELGAGFNEASYKAQAVAARTYAAQRMEQGETITDTDSHQVYRDRNQIRSAWGETDYNKYFPLIEKAVRETKGEVLTYNGSYIEALFFSTSNGRTEEPQYVWGGRLDYLKSVDSHWDTRSPYYYRVTTFSNSEFASRLGVSTGNLYAQVTSRTANGSVNTINIGGRVFSGNYVKSRLGLRSTDFTVKFGSGKVTVEQRGWGHSVGLSQYGAYFMGQEGYTYDQILHHYYSGVKIVKI